MAALGLKNPLSPLAPPRGPPSTKMRVLNLGLSRTGTSSMTAAFRILFNAPAYHGGAQTLLSGSTCQKAWIEIMTISKSFAKDPTTRTPAALAKQKYLLACELEGFCAVSDSPAINYAAELRALYPDAKIIITTRDPEKWHASLAVVTTTVMAWWFRYLLWPVPGMRRWPDMLPLLRIRNVEVRGKMTRSAADYQKHIDYVRREVPEKEIHYFDVREGWGPLCEILGVKVPDCPFPRENDAEAVKKGLRAVIIHALSLWVAVFVMVIGGGLLLLRKLSGIGRFGREL